VIRFIVLSASLACAALTVSPASSLYAQAAAPAQPAAPAAPGPRGDRPAPAAPEVKTTGAVHKNVKVAPGLYEIVYSRSLGLVYVASVGSRQEPGSAKIVGLDPASLEVKQTIPVPDAPAFGLGINDKTQMLYTSNTRTGNVSAIDLKTSKIVSTIKVDDDPKAHLFRVLVDEDKNLVYVSVTGGRVWVIDGKTNQLSHVLQDIGKTTIGLALDPSTNRLFAANNGSADIAVIDLEARKVTAHYPTGTAGPTMLAFDAKSKRLFVTSQDSADLTAIDATSGKVIKSVPTGAGALGIGFNPENNRIYVANRRAGTVTVLDAKSLDVVENLTAGTLPNTVAVDAKGKRVFVTNKAKSGGRNAPPVDDPSGDTVSLITH
jgi:YVTN family beta-propeller protein